MKISGTFRLKPSNEKEATDLEKFLFQTPKDNEIKIKELVWNMTHTPKIKEVVFYSGEIEIDL